MQLSGDDGVIKALGVCSCPVMMVLSKLWLVQLSGDDGVIKALGVCSCPVMMVLSKLWVCAAVWW